MNFHIFTFGCKVNAYESQSLRERLLSDGHIETSEKEADLFFINTCAVTKEAERKDLQKVRRISRLYPGKRIYIMGCSAQIHKEYYLDIPGVFACTGTSNRHCLEKLGKEENNDYVGKNPRLFDYEDTPVTTSEHEVRGYIKIQDGCDNFCAYCVVPLTRGRSRSRSSISILKEAKALIDEGVKELIIGGIDTGSYKDPDTGSDLVQLLKSLVELSDKDYRIRVSSIEMTQITEEYIQFFKNHPDKLCPHFHLPLQSGCQKILEKMNRKYSLRAFKAMIEHLNDEIPNIALSTDVITGFPGETEEDFQETYNFVKSCGFMRIHAFPYSERPFTKASIMKDSVPMKTRMDRVKELIELGELNEKNYREQLEGIHEIVLIEEKDEEGYAYGYSQHYLRYKIEDASATISTFYPLKEY